MKYLVFGCDPAGDRVLWEEDALHASAMPVGLPPGLVADMLAWNRRMAHALHADTNATGALAHLNAVGEDLAKQVASAVEGGAKVRYSGE